MSLLPLVVESARHVFLGEADFRQDYLVQQQLEMEQQDSGPPLAADGTSSVFGLSSQKDRA